MATEHYFNQHAQAGTNSSFTAGFETQETLKILSILYSKLASSTTFLSIIGFLNSNIISFKSIVSVLLFIFNYKKIKYIFRLYLIAHLFLLSVYLYNRSVVKFINIDLPKLYSYMDRHGKINKTIAAVYNSIVSNALTAEDKVKVDFFVNNYLINGFKLVVVPLKQTLVRTLQDIENLVHGYVNI